MSNSTQSTRLAKRNDLHLMRKLWHMGMGVFGLYCYFKLGLSQEFTALLGVILAFIAITVDIVRFGNPVAQKLFTTALGPFMRRSELESFTGFPFYALGVAVTLVLFKEPIAVLAVLFLVFADPIASLVGVQFGKDKIFKNKSVQGSLAALFVCTFITLLYGQVYGVIGFRLIIFSVLAGIIGSASEICSFKIDDNLTIPILSGLGLSVLNYLIPIF
jgi:dolichol kinase